ncbi:MAG: hypothetical protein Ta2A_09530 [Treponemataceae bacterium]|nr:MAG: hypothetical protein Ta2A_09530 [Treponemataceae bacterium]
MTMATFANYLRFISTVVFIVVYACIIFNGIRKRCDESIRNPLESDVTYYSKKNFPAPSKIECTLMVITILFMIIAEIIFNRYGDWEYL